MRIQTVTLQDFQAHRSLVLDTAHTITCIVGRTDCGKSAIVRALRWAALNAIAGDEFVRTGAERAVVELEIENGVRVARERGRHNIYRLGEDEFKAFGVGVPDAIADCLRMGTLNFQSQHDSPFWFSETAGEISRQLNAIVDLRIIDTSLGAVASRVRQAQERMTVTKENLEQTQEKLIELRPQMRRVQDFKRLDEMRERTEQSTKAASGLSSMLERLRNVRERGKANAARYEEGTAVIQRAAQFFRLDSQVGKLQLLIERIETNQAIKAPPSTKIMDDTAWAMQNKQDDVEVLKTLIDQLEKQQTRVEQRQARLAAAETKFHRLTKGKSCPVCGKPL